LLAGRGLGSASIEVTYAASLPQARWQWLSLLALTAGVIMGAALTWAAYFLNQTNNIGSASSLSLHEKAGQLTIAWSPVVAARGAKLEILDGGHQMTLSVARPLAGITYAADSNDVQIRLTPAGDGQVETARYLVQEQPLAILQAQFAAALAEAYALHTTIVREDERIAHLESSARALDQRTQIRSQPVPRPRAHQTPVVTRWWR